MESTVQVPPGGWRYKQDQTNTTVVGSSWEDLVIAVTNHRRLNGIAKGDVEEDIRGKFRKDYPSFKISF